MGRGYDEGGNGFAWFLAGLGLGAVIGVLYAPKSGAETRQDIINAADEGREFVTNRARQARDQASQWVDRGRDILSQQRDNVTSAVRAGKEAYRQATNEGTTGTGTSSSSL
ncbi:MAG TPA: YtxH domain-containing protein [Terriglobales bacterium]|nr:YtxH domain-containing protein [Terriglobales bacterium]